MTDSHLANCINAVFDKDDALALFRGAVGRESITGNEENFVAYLDEQMRARGVSGVTLAFAHHMAGALACARGDLDAAEAHLAAQRATIGDEPRPPD